MTGHAVTVVVVVVVVAVAVVVVVVVVVVSCLWCLRKVGQFSDRSLNMYMLAGAG